MELGLLGTGPLPTLLATLSWLELSFPLASWLGVSILSQITQSCGAEWKWKQQGESLPCLLGSNRGTWLTFVSDP